MWQAGVISRHRHKITGHKLRALAMHDAQHLGAHTVS
jgi:hypothetical protein